MDIRKCPLPYDWWLENERMICYIICSIIYIKLGQTMFPFGRNISDTCVLGLSSTLHLVP